MLSTLHLKIAYIILFSVHKHRILVTGANGQLGMELRDLALSHPEYSFSFLSREELAIENAEEVKRYFSTHRPTAIINCAAYTAVDKAETEKEQAFRINSEAVGILAAASREIGARFIHVSTDYVYDGNASIPYTESSFTSPVNAYGDSKLSGELEALEKNHSSVIVRTSWVYSSYGKNFVKTMLRLMKDKTEISVVNDQLGSPTYAADLASALLAIAVSEDFVPGIFHYSNDGAISWFDFASEIALQSGASCKVKPIPTSDFPTPAKRPQYSVMDKSLIIKTYDLELKPWKTSLSDCIRRIGE